MQSELTQIGKIVTPKGSRITQKGILPTQMACGLTLALELPTQIPILTTQVGFLLTLMCSQKKRRQFDCLLMLYFKISMSNQACLFDVN